MPIRSLGLVLGLAVLAAGCNQREKKADGKKGGPPGVDRAAAQFTLHVEGMT
jgi:hypothetical protein